MILEDDSGFTRSLPAIGVQRDTYASASFSLPDDDKTANFREDPISHDRPGYKRAILRIASGRLYP
jgi:hypothetical protein